MLFGPPRIHRHPKPTSASRAHLRESWDLAGLCSNITSESLPQSPPNPQQQRHDPANYRAARRSPARRAPRSPQVSMTSSRELDEGHVIVPDPVQATSPMPLLLPAAISSNTTDPRRARSPRITRPPQDEAATVDVSTRHSPAILNNQDLNKIA